MSSSHLRTAGLSKFVFGSQSDLTGEGLNRVAIGQPELPPLHSIVML